VLTVLIRDRGPTTTLANVSGGGANYRAEYKVSAPGQYNIRVVHNNSNVATSSVVVTGKASTRSTVSGAKVINTGQCYITIQGIDSDGRQMVVGNEAWAIELSGPEGGASQPTLQDKGDGTWSVSSNLSIPSAKYSFGVKIQGQHISNSPYEISTC